jgi:dienelactone hydrolase
MFAKTLTAAVLFLLPVKNSSFNLLARHFRDGDHTVSYESYGNNSADSGILVLLPGANGPRSYFYRDRTRSLSRMGYRVLVLHYLDVTEGSAELAAARYPVWSHTVTRFIGMLKAEFPSHQVGLVGYSLGASVALMAASRDAQAAAVVDWYGSLPDEAAAELRHMPPLLILHGAEDHVIPVADAEQLEALLLNRGLACSSHIYADQGHGFTGDSLVDADNRTARFLAQYVH